MPALDRLTIQGYKSIRDATVELRAVNVLIGANGDGKSNFIGFFRLLHMIALRQLQYHVAKAGGASNLLHYGLKTTGQISANLLVGMAKYAIYLEPRFGNDLFIVHEEVGSLDISDGRSSWYPNMGSESLLALASDVWKQEATLLLKALEGIGAYHLNDTSATSPLKQPAALNDNEYLREDGSNLAAILYLLQERHPAHLKQIEAVVRRVVPAFDRFRLRPDPLAPTQVQLEWREQGSDFPFLASHFSDGALRFVMLATLLLQPEPPSTIVIDEPELGLHPAAIGVLAGMVRVASERTQIVLATQAPALVNEFAPEDVITVDRVDGASTFTRHSAEELAAWLDTYSLAELWEKNVIGGTP